MTRFDTVQLATLVAQAHDEGHATWATAAYDVTQDFQLALRVQGYDDEVVRDAAVAVYRVADDLADRWWADR